MPRYEDLYPDTWTGALAPPINAGSSPTDDIFPIVCPETINAGRTIRLPGTNQPHKTAPLLLPLLPVQLHFPVGHTQRIHRKKSTWILFRSGCTMPYNNRSGKQQPVTQPQINLLAILGSPYLGHKNQVCPVYRQRPHIRRIMTVITNCHISFPKTGVWERAYSETILAQGQFLAITVKRMYPR